MLHYFTLSLFNPLQYFIVNLTIDLFPCFKEI